MKVFAMILKDFYPETPCWWANAAAEAAAESLSPGACHIGQILWRLYRMRGGKAGCLKLPTKDLKKRGLGRAYINTSLKTLESAGLVVVKRFTHKSPEITLIVDQALAKDLANSFGGNGKRLLGRITPGSNGEELGGVR